MSEEGLAMVNELGFLWEDNQSQLISSWANLSNNNSENNYSSGGTDQSTGHEEKTDTPPVGVGGQIGNIDIGSAPKKGKDDDVAAIGGNRKRSRGSGGKNNNNGNNSDDNNIGEDGAKLGESDHEIHIWTERERRKKMRNMFSNLHALLPQLPSKADKSTIVDEAVNYIRTLQQTLQRLQKQKLEKLHSGAGASTATTGFTLCEPSNKLAVTREAFMADQGSCGINNLRNTTAQSSVVFQTWTSSNVVLNLSGDEAHISICSPKKPGLLSAICYVLEKHKIAVVSAQISSDGARSMYMIHAHANGSGASDQFEESSNSVEEVFKQAVGEIIFWVSS